MKRAKLLVILVLFSAFSSRLKADYGFDAGAEVNLGTGNNNFAPFYLHSNRFGKITQARNFQIDLWAEDPLDPSKKFDFSWGVEALAGYANKVDYRRWNPDTKEWYDNPQGPAAIWLQQLYAEVKWRSLFLSIGLKDRESAFVDQKLSSGDLIWSGNTRGIPEARIGFIDFQNIPLTKQWVQIDACLSYGKFIDTNWINDHFNYYTGKRNPGGYWTYKRLSLRTNPEKPFSFHIGIQMTGIFGGYTYYYDKGELYNTVNNYTGAKDFIEMLLPFWSSSTEGYRVGDTKGSWDLAGTYRFKSGESLRVYAQWPWEDSSGIAKKNGFDGLWGVEFKTGRRWWITAAVIEYLDLTNMSGPLIYDPAYAPDGEALPGFAGGRDAYYNNFYYRAYTNYGLNMGTPMVPGTLFFTEEGGKAFVDGTIPYFRTRGFHVAVEGSLSDNFDYIIKYNHRKSWGDTNSYALIYPIEADSFMAGLNYHIPKIPGLTLGGSVGVDHGTMPSDSYGLMLSLTYERPFIFGKK